MEHLEKGSKEKEDGGDSSEIDNDALTKALGKKDYNGYVKGIGRSGVGVGRRKAFGKVSRKGSEPRDEEIQALKTTIAKLEANQSQFVAQLEAQRSEFKAYIASLSEVNKEVVSKPYKEEKSTTIEVIREVNTFNFIFGNKCVILTLAYFYVVGAQKMSPCCIG